MTSVYLKHSSINSGAAVQIYCTGVTVSFSKSNDKKPNANYNTSKVAEVQSLSLENPKYTLSNVKLGEIKTSVSEAYLSYYTLLQFYKLPNDSSDPIILNVTYGNRDSLTSDVSGNYIDLVGFDGATTDIPVTFDGSLSVPFDTTNSTNAYRPSFNINLVEVRT